MAVPKLSQRAEAEVDSISRVLFNHRDFPEVETAEAEKKAQGLQSALLQVLYVCKTLWKSHLKKEKPGRLVSHPIPSSIPMSEHTPLSLPVLDHIQIALSSHVYAHSNYSANMDFKMYPPRIGALKVKKASTPYGTPRGDHCWDAL